MSDPNAESDAPGVSHATVVEAERVTNALAQKGVPIEGVVFDEQSDTYHVVTPGGTVGDGDVSDGDELDTQGVGGGNIKSAE